MDQSQSRLNKPLAIAAPDPPLEPPAILAGSHGFRVVP